MYTNPKGPHRVRRQIAVVALSGTVLLVSGACSSDSDSDASTGHAEGISAGPAAVTQPTKPENRSQPTGAPTTSPAPDDGTPDGGMGSVPNNPGPLAPKEYKPVIRDGRRPQPSITAQSEPFDRRVRYPDGVTLKVTKMAQHEMTGEGPGVFPGRLTTAVHFTLVNESNKKLQMDAVVVTAIYGKKQRIAYPVYDGDSRDFSGSLASGKSTSAVYSFAIPKKALSNVKMFVDFDGEHAAATFNGPVG